MNESNPSDAALAELLTLTVGVNQRGTYYRNHLGQLHRIHGPAVIHGHGGECWYQNGQIHRTHGPAMIFSNGSKLWYLYDKLLTEKEHHDRLRTRYV